MPSSTDSVTSLATVLRQYRDSRASSFADARKALAIGDLDAKALIYIAGHPGTRPGDLTVLLGITSAGVTTLTDRLIERGLVERTLDTDDRRVVRISAIVDLATEPWSALTKFDDEVVAAAATLSAPEVDRLTAALKAIVETVAPTPAS